MAKFEVEMELQGFRLKVKAEREDDVSRITQQIGRQLSGFTQPFAGIVDSSRIIETQAVTKTEGNGEAAVPRKSAAKTTRKRARKVDENSMAQAITWQHDASVWGTPKQKWTAAQKILWTTYVIEKKTGRSEVSGPEIADAFNRTFKEFGPLNKQNMPRDLGSLKTRSPAQVMSNAGGASIMWYLTEAGKLEAEKLVAEARGFTGGSNAE